MFKSFMTGKREIKRHLERLEKETIQQHENNETDKIDTEISTCNTEQ